jgi:hypothetical protein
MPYNSDSTTSKGSFAALPQQSSSINLTSGPPIIPSSFSSGQSSFEPFNQPKPSQPGPYGAPSNQYSTPLASHPPGPASQPSPNSPNSWSGAPQADPRQYNNQPIAPPYEQYNAPVPAPAPVAGYSKPSHGQQPSISSPLNPRTQRYSDGPGGPGGPVPAPNVIPVTSPTGARGPTFQNSRPLFGVPLTEIFNRDHTAVPLVIEQCLNAVEHYGLDHEGIYRSSGNANQVAQLKARFDHDSASIDFRYPEEFFNDINVPATLLKQFLRELPDPLLTKRSHQDFLDAATVPDDTARRDRLHAAINDLPDPHYATLRMLILV